MRLLALLLLVAPADAERRPIPLRPAPAVTGQPLPSLDLRALDGTPWNPATQEARPQLLYFWATWCGPCMEGLQALPVVQAAWPDVSVVAVNVDRDPSGVPDALEDWKGGSIPVVVDDRARLMGRLDLEELPVSVVADRLGRVRGRFQVAPDAPVVADALRDAP